MQNLSDAQSTNVQMKQSIDQVKFGPSKICGKDPLKELMWYDLLTDHIISIF